MKLSVLTLVAACALTPAVAEPAPDAVFVLRGVGGFAFPPAGYTGQPVTVGFPMPGQVAGQAPCNRWFASWSGTAGNMAIGPVAATRMACPELAMEARVLGWLAGVTTLQETPFGILLSGPDILPLEFARQP